MYEKGNGMSIVTSFEGVVVDDPTFKITASGTPMANIRLAINERVRDKETGVWRDGDSTYLTVMAWNQMAENATDSLKRGDRAVVIGKMKERKWTDKDGNARTSFEETADSIGVSIKFNAVQSKRGEKVTRPAGRSDSADSTDDWNPPF